MFDRLLDWVEANYLKATAILVLALVIVVSLGLAQVARAATLDGTFTMPTRYEDGSVLPQANVKHIRVEVGTCSTPSVFGTREGEHLVAPPATAWSVTVPRAFGAFCARAQTETVSGTLSNWTGTVTKTIAEPKPLPPTLQTLGGWVWELKPNGLRFAGIIQAGRPCSGELVRGPDLYAVNRADVRLGTHPGPNAVLLAQCVAT